LGNGYVLSADDHTGAQGKFLYERIHCVSYEIALSKNMPNPKFRWLSFTVIVCLAGTLLGRAAGPAKLVVMNAQLMTMAPNQKEPFIGYLVVDDDGTLTEVGRGQPPTGLVAKSTWDAHGAWIIPGFLSAHSHLWQSAFRGIAADKTLPGWIDGLYNQRASHAKAEDYYWFTLHGALDHLEHGITGAYDFVYGGTRWACAREMTAIRRLSRVRSTREFALYTGINPIRLDRATDCPRRGHG
jgi:hypothetical protein